MRTIEQLQAAIAESEVITITEMADAIRTYVPQPAPAPPKIVRTYPSWYEDMLEDDKFKDAVIQIIHDALADNIVEDAVTEALRDPNVMDDIRDTLDIEQTLRELLRGVTLDV